MSRDVARSATDFEQLRVGVVPPNHLGESAQQRSVERSIVQRGAEQLGVLLRYDVVTGPSRNQVRCLGHGTQATKPAMVSARRHAAKR